MTDGDPFAELRARLRRALELVDVIEFGHAEARAATFHSSPPQPTETVASAAAMQSLVNALLEVEAVRLEVLHRIGAGRHARRSRPS